MWKENIKQPVFWLFISSASLFLGKMFQAGSSGTAIVECLGYESWLSGLVGLWMPWEEYAVDIYPTLSEMAAGFWTAGYFIAFAGLFLPGTWRWAIWLGAILLLLEAIMSMAGQYYWLVSFLEKSLMIVTPVLYLSAKYPEDRLRINWAVMGRLAVVIVFVIHGMYALTIFPRPGYWIEMVSMVTGFSGEWAGWFLNGIGVLDILVAGWVLLRPGLSNLVWYYLIAWGLLTAIARILGFIQEGFVADALTNWGYETLIRLPHGLVPLALYLRRSND